MTDQRISDLFDIKSRFLRSAHLERDFDDADALAGYVPTDFVRSCFDRIGEGLRPRSGHRAWRVTGDYGSGKSSFALLLAHALAGRDHKLPPQLLRVVDFKKHGVARPQFLPVLVTCSRQPLATSILRAVHRSLTGVYRRGAKAKPAAHIQRLLDAKAEPSDEQIIDAVLQANSQLIADSKSQGLLLLIDELGKFLEFAALNPHRQDVFLLQRLAEAASRSGDEPLFVVCLLHQGFNAYADQLSQPSQREWEKVAGRFDEIVFNQPVEQVGHLIASALNVRVERFPKAHTSSLRQAMEQTIELGWFGAVQAQRQPLLNLAPRLYPLHPTVLPVLIRLFQRFGQNERSLFSFLLSNEPFGLQPFSDLRLNEARPYRLHDLFDYVRTNFGHRLTVQSYRSHWNLIESVVESYATEEPLHVQVLKTVGILNLLNDNLLATEESVVCALAAGDHAHQRQVKAALDKLQKVKRVLYDRGRSGGFCLWPHTSADLEKAYDDARRAVQTPQHEQHHFQGHRSGGRVGDAGSGWGLRFQRFSLHHWFPRPIPRFDRDGSQPHLRPRQPPIQPRDLQLRGGRRPPLGLLAWNHRQIEGDAVITLSFGFKAADGHLWARRVNVAATRGSLSLRPGEGNTQRSTYIPLGKSQSPKTEYGSLARKLRFGP